MNSTPADCRAEQIFFPLSSPPPKGPSLPSKRLMVGMDTSAAAANSSWDQARSDRAALICLIDTFSIDFAIESTIFLVSMTPPESRDPQWLKHTRNQEKSQTDATSSAARTPGSLWAATKPPLFG